ncbi:SWIM zinc finger domain-containing protein [Schaalia sp. Marseille-Q2122]|uniref:SWIM zinc finger family protein n=1 Tax=Schaalia sp. Marseille-Q2122 TaxID=2736604 RepID=UPI00158B22B6|nr:hypothetical protein [Schaalia sp. Marseille-Q2122]
MTTSTSFDELSDRQSESVQRSLPTCSTPEVVCSALSVPTLRAVAGAKVLGRAYEYIDALTILDRAAGHAEAISELSSPYAVELWWDHVGIHGRCCCPYGNLGHFCKHMVALGLRILREENLEQTSKAPGIGKHAEGQQSNDACLPQREQSIHRFLQTITGEQARAMLMEVYQEEEDLDELLQRRSEIFEMRSLDKTESLFARIREATRPYKDQIDLHFVAYMSVEESIRDLKFLADSGHEHIAYVAVERLLFRFLAAYGSAENDCTELRCLGKDLLSLHVTLTGRVALNPQQLACALVTMRDAKPQWLHMSFLPYLSALGQDGRSYCQREVDAIEERLKSGGGGSTQRGFFQAKYADAEHILSRQRRELRLMKAELAYMSGEYDSVLESLEGAVPTALPGMISVALAREDFSTAADLVEQAYEAQRVSASGAHGPWNADSLSAVHIAPQWAQEILIRARRREEAAEYAREYFISHPDTESAQMWIDAIAQTDFEAKEREALRQWLLTHPSRYCDGALPLFLMVGDHEGAWQWVDAHGAGRSWRHLVFHDPQPYPQRALELAVEVCTQRLENGARWELLADDIAMMHELARQADDHEGTNRYTQWVKHWRDRLWRLYMPHFQP